MNVEWCPCAPTCDHCASTTQAKQDMQQVSQMAAAATKKITGYASKFIGRWCAGLAVFMGVRLHVRWGIYLPAFTNDCGTRPPSVL